jgi:hypothetical protein
MITISVLVKVNGIRHYSFIDLIMSPPTLVGRHIVFVLSVRHTVCQRNSSETIEQNFMKIGR